MIPRFVTIIGLLNDARRGLLGTPEQPVFRCDFDRHFWSGYFGQRKLSEYPPRSQYYRAAKAGYLWRQEHELEGES